MELIYSISIVPGGLLVTRDCQQYVPGFKFISLTVVDHSADSFDLVDDSSAHPLQELTVEREPVCGHEVCGLYCTKRNALLMCTLVAHDADSLSSN